MQCLSLAVQACTPRPPIETKAPKRDAAAADPAAEPTPITAAIGPHLVLVPRAPHEDEDEDAAGSVTTRSAETPTKQARLSGPSASARPEQGQGQPQGALHAAAAITTNDLLDCLVHPDVISRVTELLLEKRSGRRPRMGSLDPQ